MSIQGSERVSRFVGESRGVADENLPDGVSPDALNCDYGVASLGKRKGFRKLHGEAVKAGGLRVTNAAGTRGVSIAHHVTYSGGLPSGSAYDFTSEMTFEIFVIVHSYSGSGRIAHKLNGAGSSGWTLDFTGGVFTFSVVDAGGTVRSAASAAFELGKRYHVVGGKSSAGVVSISMNGTVVTGATGAGYTNNTDVILLGANNNAATQTVDVTIDEVRLWSVARTDAEIASTSMRELNEVEADGASLIGYWRLNDGRGYVAKDWSRTANAGRLSVGPASYVSGLVPAQGAEGFAARFDGHNDYGAAPYHAAYAPILNTGNVWTFEAWVRLDNANYDTTAGAPSILHVGSWSTGKGAVVGLLLASTGDRSLLVTYSTTTTHANVSADTTFDFIPGVAVHVAVVRNAATVTVYINGESVYSSGAATTENGPTSSTSYGVYFGGRNSAGSWDANRYSPVTIDECRLWSTARSREQIQRYMKSTYPDVKAASLVGYWRFDAGTPGRDETGRSAVTFGPSAAGPAWSRGLVFPVEAQRMLLCAPLVSPLGANAGLASRTPMNRELVVATQTDWWSVIGDEARHLKAMQSPGEPSLFSSVQHQGCLVAVNGIEPNTKYDGLELSNLTIAMPSAGPTAALGAAGLITGTGLTYRVAFRNSRDGTESLASAASGAVSPATQKVELTNVPVSTDPQVDSRVIYRQEAGTYRYHGTIADNTTTTYTDNTAYGLATAVVNDLRGEAPKARLCAVWNNALWLFNLETAPSGIRFSEVASSALSTNGFDFPAANALYVDRNDGDEITGAVAAFGGMVIFKEKSIHFLMGDAASGYTLRRTIPGEGCVSGHTVQACPEGVYYLSRGGARLLVNPEESSDVGAAMIDLWETLDAERYRSAAAVYDGTRKRYLCSADFAEGTGGAYYDELAGLFASYWELETAGTDRTAARNLVASGTPAYVTDGEVGGCVDLDGASGFSAGAVSSYPAAFSFGCWVRFDSAPAGAAHMNLFRIEDSTGAVYARFGLRIYQYWNVGSASLFNVPLNTWVHAVFTYSGGVAKVWMNGKLAAWNYSYSLGGTTGTGAMFVGSNGTSGTDVDLDGRMKRAWYATAALTESQVAALYAYELAGGRARRSRKTLVRYEGVGGWAEWDAGFDALCEFRGANQAEVLGARRGFVHRLFDGDGDGAQAVGGGALKWSGTLSANGSALITEGATSFSQVGDGLAGVDVVGVPSTAGLPSQRRMAIGNDGTNLHLDRAFSPAVTGMYFVGPIDFQWESRWMELGSVEWVKTVRYLSVYVKTAAPVSTILVEWRSEQTDWASRTFTNVSEFLRMDAPAHGRRVKVRFTAFGHEGFTLTSFQFEPEVKRAV